MAARTRVHIPLMILLALAVAACGATSQPETGDVAEEIDALAAEMVEDDTPGMAILVIEDGEVAHAEEYGLANLDDERPITPQTIFHLASCGKQMTALAIMQLAHEGKLGYDDPVARHIGELASLDEAVTIRRLLQHTGALPDVYEQLAERAEMPTNDDLLALFAELDELDGTPGDAESYSNVGYDVLGSLVERVSGQKFEDFLRDRIFRPLEMTSTFSLPNPEGLANPERATGYDAGDDGFEVLDSDPLDNLRGSGSVYTSIDDMYPYDQALYTDELLPQTAMAAAFRPGKLNGGKRVDYGFGWELGEYNGRRYTAHSGTWIGFVSYYLRYPDDRLSVVILANRADLDVETLAYSIADLY